MSSVNLSLCWFFGGEIQFWVASLLHCSHLTSFSLFCCCFFSSAVSFTWWALYTIWYVLLVSLSFSLLVRFDLLIVTLFITDFNLSLNFKHGKSIFKISLFKILKGSMGMWHGWRSCSTRRILLSFKWRTLLRLKWVRILFTASKTKLTPFPSRENLKIKIMRFATTRK